MWRTYRICLCIFRACLTASTMFPVPAYPFVRIMHAPYDILLNAYPKFRAPQTKGTLNLCLLIWLS